MQKTAYKIQQNLQKLLSAQIYTLENLALDSQT